MNFLQVVKNNYGFEKAIWKDQNTIETEHGLKRVLFWEDPYLLQWHIAWRDACSIFPFVLTNRMLRTTDGKTEVHWEKGWFTVHDTVTTLSPMSGAEHVWGMLLGNLISFGEKYKEKVLEKRWKIPSLKKEEAMIWKTDLKADAKNLLNACLKEGINRTKKGKSLIEANKDLPLLDPLQTPSQGKAVFQMLYWEGTNLPPEKGFHSFVKFLQEWYIKNGETSLICLLNEIERYCPLREHYGKVLIGEAMLPWELEQFFNNLQKTNSQRAYEIFVAEWEGKRKFVLLLGKWFADVRKKVAVT